MFLAEFTEDPRCVVFEFEVIPRAWGELITNDVKIVLVPCGIILVRECAFKFRLTPRDLKGQTFDS